MKVSRIGSQALLSIIVISLAIIGCGGDDNPVSQTGKTTVFAKNYGGANDEIGADVKVTSDGGYIVAGSERPDGGTEDAYLIRLDNSGNLIWEKTFGGVNHDHFGSVVQNSDGGFTSGGGTSTSPGIYDFYLVRTDINGNIVWERNFGGTGSEYGSSMCAASGGGYVIAGSKSGDIYIMKIDNNGTFVWDKTYGGAEDEWGHSVSSTSDGGFIITGRSNSFGSGDHDVYLIRTDSDGDSLWTKTYGGTDDEIGLSVAQTSDNGFIITGTRSEAGLNDIYLLRTDLNGDFQWSKTFGGNRNDVGESVHQTSDGGYIIAGHAENDSTAFSLPDLYLLKTDYIGIIQWEKIFDETSNSEGRSVIQTSDGGYVVTGFTSTDGTSRNNMYLLKTDADGNVK